MGLWSDYWETVKSIGKQVFAPTLGQFISGALSMVTSRWLGKTSGVALQTLAPISTATSLVLNITPAIALTNAISAAAVRVPDDQIYRYFQPALMMTAVSAGVFSVVACYSGDIFVALGQPSEVGREIDAYFRAVAVTGGLIPFLGMMPLRRVASVLKRPNIMLAMSMSQSVLCLAASAVVNYKMPTAEGFGYAFSIGNWITFAGFSCYLACGRDMRDLGLFTGVGGWTDWDKYKALLSKAGVMMSGIVFESLIITVISGLIGREGTEAGEAYSIANQYSKLLIMLSLSVGAGISSLCRQSGSAKEIAQKRLRLLNAGVGISTLLFAAPILLFSLVIPRMLIDFYKEGDFSTAEATDLLRIVAFGNIADAIRLVNNNVGSVVNPDRVNLAINLPSLGTGLALSLGAYFMGLGPTLLVGGFYLGVAAAGAIQWRNTYNNLQEKISNISITFFGCTRRGTGSLEEEALLSPVVVA